MPVETIKCTGCGSADVTEFKPGSYVCGHCETIFKHVTPGGGGPASCEIDGDCGVLAVGLCRTCGRTFCATHQAWGWQPTSLPGIGGRDIPYVDLCTACDRERTARMRAEMAKEAQEKRIAEEKKHEEWVARLHRLQRIEDPIERLVLAVSSRQLYREHTRQLAGIDTWNELFPMWPCSESWRGSPPFLDRDPPWEPSLWDMPGYGDASRQTARWFAARAQSAGLTPNDTAEWYRAGLWDRKGRKSKKCTGPAWKFGRQIVLPDGTLCGAGTFDAGDLEKMASLLGLRL